MVRRNLDNEAAPRICGDEQNSCENMAYTQYKKHW